MQLKVGLLGIGLDTYWPQFEGLREKLLSYQQAISIRISEMEVEVVNVGIVDHYDKSIQAAAILRQKDVTLIFLYVSTYALSSTVLPIVQRLHLPVVVLNIQPVATLDYTAFNALGDRGKMTGRWLEHCQACAVPEIASVLNRADIPFHVVTGYMDEAYVWTEIQAWVAAARTVAIMHNNRMGLLGHYYNGMLDVYTDLTKMSAVFGTHFEMLEMCEIKKIREEVNDQEVGNKMTAFHTAFEVDLSCSRDELYNAARTSVALDKIIERHALGSLAYYYEGMAGNEYENIVTSMIAGNTLLTGNNIPIAGEYEVKNAHAMKIMAALGAGGSFSEFYLIDFTEDVVLMGHDGPAHFAIAEGPVKLVPLPLYHGKPGEGLSIQMRVRKGPVTLLSVVEGKNEISLLVAEGESVEGPIVEIGNTNSRYRFPLSVRVFLDTWNKAGPAHHCAIGVGHLAGAIEKVAALLKIPVVRVC